MSVRKGWMSMEMSEVVSRGMGIRERCWELQGTMREFQEGIVSFGGQVRRAMEERGARAGSEEFCKSLHSTFDVLVVTGRDLRELDRQIWGAMAVLVQCEELEHAMCGRRQGECQG
jgi:hypothetical protein